MTTQEEVREAWAKAAKLLREIEEKSIEYDKAYKEADRLEKLLKLQDEYQKAQGARYALCDSGSHEFKSFDGYICCNYCGKVP